jgi:hypothetical protein
MGLLAVHVQVIQREEKIFHIEYIKENKSIEEGSSPKKLRCNPEYPNRYAPAGISAVCESEKERERRI